MFIALKDNPNPLTEQRAGAIIAISAGFGQYCQWW